MCQYIQPHGLNVFSHNTDLILFRWDFIQMGFLASVSLPEYELSIMSRLVEELFSQTSEEKGHYHCN